MSSPPYEGGDVRRTEEVFPANGGAIADEGGSRKEKEVGEIPKPLWTGHG